MRIGLSELILIQIILYAGLWLLSPYAGFMLSMIVTTISTAVLVISLIMELIDRSKVPKFYFYAMITAIVCPLIVTLFFIAFYPGAMSWMKG
jgi:hypothetical protein